MTSAETGRVEPGPWIFETMIGWTARNHRSGELTTVECPGPACRGLLIELIDGRIAAHDSRREVPCTWTGVRVIACPEDPWRPNVPARPGVAVKAGIQ